VKHTLGSLEVDDQVAGVLVLESLGLASPASGVGIFGWSYGGYMTLMCLAKRPDVFTVGASGAPVSNWDGCVLSTCRLTPLSLRVHDLRPPACQIRHTLHGAIHVHTTSEP
jgi:dipeptidyl aminopeptidase/acylaminoacyl peptidase